MATLGFVLASVIVVATSRVSEPEPAQARLLGSWMGLLSPRGTSGALATAFPVLVLVGVAALVVAWVAVVRACSRRQVSIRGTAGLCVAWGAPFLLGPPLFSRDVYSFIAQGELARVGLNPYRVAPSSLGPSPLVTAIGRHWRGTTSPYGPLATRLEELASLAGRSVGAVAVLRVEVVLAVAVTLVCAAWLAPPHARATVIALFGLCPVVLLHLLSGLHLESAMAALMVAGLLVHRRGHPVAGIALVVAGGAVKAPAFLAAGLLAIDDVRAVWELGAGARLRVAARDAATGAAAFAACSLLLPDPLGWVHAMSTADAGRTLTMPAVALGHLLGAAAGAIHLGIASNTALAAGAGIFAVAAMAGVIGLVVTSKRRDLTATVGLALLLCGLLGPVLHPWYLVWGLAPLLPVAAGITSVRRLAMTCCGALVLFELPALPGNPGPTVWTLELTLLALVVAATAWRERRRRRVAGILAVTYRPFPAGAADL